MCELLISNNRTYFHSNPAKDRRGVHKCGDILFKGNDGDEWGSEQGLPKAVILKLPGIDVPDEHTREWKMGIKYSVVGSDP